MTRAWDWFCEQVLFYEGSTRPAALLRILLALLMWARWATPVAPFTNDSPERLLLAVSFYISTSMMLFGICSRFSTAWAGGTALMMVFVFGPNGVEAWAHHHTTLLALSVAMCALTPCGHSYSWDRWMAIADPHREPPPERAPLWGMRLIAFHVSVVYFWTAWDKTFWGFLSGDRMGMAIHTLYLGSDFPMAGFDELMMVSAIITVVIEYFLVFGLWVPRWHWWTFPLGFIFHALIFIILPIGTFTVTMYALYLAFLDADAFHEWIDEISGVTPATAPR